MTSAYGGYFDTSVSAGNITTAYGVYVGTISGATKYSVYASDSAAPSYFAGNVGVGTTSPQKNFHVIRAGTGTNAIFESNCDGCGSDIAVVNNGPFASGSTASVRFDLAGYGGNAGVIGARGEPGSAAGLYFSTAIVGSYTERMTIKSNGNVGIGTTGPGQKLEVNGGVRLNTATAKPTCDSTTRGTFWMAQGGAGVKDTVEVCAKDVADAYAWRTLY
jgi:hypothetical protein